MLVEKTHFEIVSSLARVLIEVVHSHSNLLSVESLREFKVNVLKSNRLTVIFPISNIMVAVQAALFALANAPRAPFSTITVPLAAPTHHIDVKIGSGSPLQVNVHSVSCQLVLCVEALEQFLGVIQVRHFGPL